MASNRNHTLITAAFITAGAAACFVGCATNTPSDNQRTPILQPSARIDTPKRPVTDRYHNVDVVDDYRWLEDWSNPEVKAWSEKQNTAARAALDNLPSVPQIRERVAGIMGAGVVSHSAIHVSAGNAFAIKRQPPKEQPFLVVMDAPDKPQTARTLVDPSTMKGTSMDWYVPSPDGSLVAVSLSSGGSEMGDVHVFDVASGKRVGEVIPRVNGGTAGGDLAWTPDSKGFFYTRYPRPGERPDADLMFYVHVYFHQLGTPESHDRYEIGKDFPRIAEITLDSDQHGHVLINMQKGDGGEFQHYLRAPAGTWTQLTTYDDRVVQAVLGPDADGSCAVYMVSRKNAPKGKLLRADANAATNPEVLIPEGNDAIVDEFFDADNLLVTPKRIYVTYQMGGPSEIRVFDHAGNPAPAPTQGQIISAGGLTPAGGDDVLFSTVGYTQPLAWHAFSATSNTTTKLDLVGSPSVSFDDYEVVREFATSKDGTKIPINIIRKKGLRLDSSHPCLVTAYGGYGVNMSPSFNAARIAFLEQGVVWAQANIRGGGEYGDHWHKQGNLLNKQNVFDDFAAACNHMKARGYTSTKRLAIEGGSNGGLLMGATMTQHPDICQAIISHVGIYDMLRVELSSNGEFNITEFGTVKDPAQFRALHAYSPYHRVRQGVAYPDTLFLTGANDPRVDPMQSRKMTARLQEVGATALLRTSSNSGHGQGTALSEQIEQRVDVLAFLFHRLGVRYLQQPTPASTPAPASPSKPRP